METGCKLAGKFDFKLQGSSVSFLTERGVCSAVEVAALLQRQITVCHGPCFAPGWLNLEIWTAALQPSTHWSHRLFTGISLHSSHYPCQGRLAPMEQSSHSLGLKQSFLQPKRNEKQRKLFWTHSGETKIFGVFLVGFLFWEGGRSLELLPISGAFRALPRALSEPRVDTEHGVSLGYLTSPAQTSASPATIQGEKHREMILIPPASPLSFPCSV